MKHLKSFLDFLLYSNIFIAVCAAAMTVESFLFINSEFHWSYIAFVFSSTLTLYNFPVFFDDNFLPERSGRHQWVSENKKLLAALFMLGLLGTGTFALFFSIKFALWFSPVALIAFAYFFPQTQLRGILGLKTFTVAFVWTCTTAIFPLLLYSDFNLPLSFVNANAAILLQNFLFIFPLCLIFNVRDIEADRKANVRTLPVIYGVKVTQLVCLIFLVLFSVLVAISLSLHQARTGLLISGVAAIGLIVFASEKRSDYYYSLWVDGLILLQAILIFSEIFF